MTDTMPEFLRPLMDGPSVKLGRCTVCGRRWPLEQHHVVFRSQGKLFDADGRERPKPTVTLCGFGNNLRDADGRYMCHGLAHHRMLHFRFEGRWEYLRTDEPTPYLDALESGGWRALDVSEHREWA